MKSAKSDNRIGWRQPFLDRTALTLAGAAVVVYVVGLWWGVPRATHEWAIHGWDVDAVTGVQTLSEIYNLLRPQPSWWVAYPLFHYLVLGVSYAPYLGYLVLTGGLSQPSADFPYGLADPVGSIAALTLIGRVVTIAMAGGTVVATYSIGKTVWNRRTGIIAALVVMLATPMVYYSRTGNLDVPVLFWTSIGIWLAARLVHGAGQPRDWAWLGAAAALSVATKDQAYGGWILALAVLALGLGGANSTGGRDRAMRWQSIAWMVVAGALVYAVAGGLVIRPNRFVAHLDFLRDFERTFPNIRQVDMLRPATLSGYVSLLGDVVQALSLALGPVLLVAGILGAAVMARSSKFTRVLAIMLLGHILLVIVPIRHMQFRYSLLPVLILALWVGHAISLGLSHGGRWRLLSAGALVLGLGWIGARGVDLTYQMLFDARLAASDWMRTHSQPGDTIAFFGPTPNTLPRLPAGVTARQLPDNASAESLLRQEPTEFVLVVRGAFTDVGLNRIPFVPNAVLSRLEDGSLGYRAVAEFDTPPLLPSVSNVPLNSMGYLVNPSLVIYRLAGEASASGE